MSKNNEKISTIAIEELENKIFTVKSYQRGYKWTVQQVFDLLEDISAFNKDDAFYCLQPLALVEHEDTEYEVIDGQQRLTTIFIILSFIDKSIYDISYKTRTGSEDFLNNIKPKLYSESIVSMALEADKLLDFEKAVGELWADYIKKNNPSNTGENVIDNTDNYHFFMAAQTILVWIREHEQKEIDLLKDNILKHTRFIWYVDPKQTEPTILFRNLNSGKIDLTNAELIKAEFINGLKNINTDIQTLQQNELASEWDYIEKELHNDEFWYFLYNNTNIERYETRIDLIFELMAGPPPKNNTDKLHTYRIFSRNNNENQGYKWDDVKLCFYQLHEWFEDNELYHLIGYLIYYKILSINEIIGLSKNRGKSDFRTSLVEEIKDDFKKLYKNVDGEFLDNLDYNNNNKGMAKTLLLYNLKIYQTSSANFRFPFDKLKLQDWSLEHIHAQKTEAFSTIKELKSWIKDIESLRDSFSGNNNKKFNNENKNFPENNFKKLKKKLKVRTEGVDELPQECRDLMNQINEDLIIFFNMHGISNMALLDKATNSSFSNDPFESKRNKLIEIDKKTWENGKSKAFIPIGTKNVFLKYTSDPIGQMNIWGWKDREDYSSHIKKTLKEYLPTSEDCNGQ